MEPDPAELASLLAALDRELAAAVDQPPGQVVSGTGELVGLSRSARQPRD